MPDASLINLCQAVRSCLGLTQQQLAAALGVSRERVGQEEAGLRPLPLHALPRLAALATCLSAAPAPPLPPPDAAALRQRQHQLLAEAARLRQRLAAAETRAAQAQARLALLPTLEAAPPVAAPAVGPAWVRVLALEAETTLAECGPTARALLGLRLGAVAQELAALDVLLGEEAGR